MKPPILYFGAKGSIAKKIVALMPEHDGYVEPFAGSLAVLLAKEPCRMEIVNDLDHRLMTFWRVVRDNPRELTRAVSLTPHSRAELEQSWTITDDMSDIEIARRVWVSLNQGRSPALGRKTGWRYFSDPVATSSTMATYMSAYRNRVEPAAERILGVTLECRPALDIIKRFGKAERTLIYVDPPYLGETRSGRNTYGFEMAEPQEHRALAVALNDCSAMVMVSGYANPLYDDHLYRGWFRREISSHTANGSGYRGRTEVIWSNREIMA